MSRWLLLFVFFALIGTAYGQNDTLDSLKATLSNTLKDSVQVKYLIQKSGSGDCVALTEAAREIAERIGYDKGLANAYKSIGICHYRESNYVDCIYNWNQALQVFQSIKDLTGEANMLSNLGVAYNELGDPVKALEYCFNSLKVAEATKDKLRIGTALLNIGANYEENPVTREESLTYFVDASKLFEEINYIEGLATCYLNIGEVHLYRGAVDLALENLEKARKKFEELQDYKSLSYTLSYKGKALQKKKDYTAAIQTQYEAYKMSRVRNYNFQTTTALVGLAESYSQLKNYDAALEKYDEARKIAEEHGLLYELKTIYAGLVPIYASLSDYKNALHYQQQLSDIGDKLFSKENARTIQKFQLEFDLEKKQAEINLLTKDKELHQAELAKNKITRNALIAGVIFLVLIAFILLRNYQIKSRSNKLLAEQNVEIRLQKEEIAGQKDDIESQKQEIEKLMLNILPVEVAQELRKTGSATPRYYESVSVLFTDFKEFTKIAETLSAQHLVAELNECFTAFDNIVEAHGLEKIKTIGDAYMCACGIPSPVEDHPIRTVRAALAMQQYINSENEKRAAKGYSLWEIRVGIHSGPVVAGVVGKKKFAYDIWGNAVNIAARLEANGYEGRVNISDSTYQLVKDKFQCHYRGKIMAKNIGDVDMYFVDKEITEAEVSSSIAI